MDPTDDVKSFPELKSFFQKKENEASSSTQRIRKASVKRNRTSTGFGRQRFKQSNSVRRSATSVASRNTTKNANENSLPAPAQETIVNDLETECPTNKEPSVSKDASSSNQQSIPENETCNQQNKNGDKQNENSDEQNGNCNQQNENYDEQNENCDEQNETCNQQNANCDEQNENPAVSSLPGTSKFYVNFENHEGPKSQPNPSYVYPTWDEEFDDDDSDEEFTQTEQVEANDPNVSKMLSLRQKLSNMSFNEAPKYLRIDIEIPKDLKDFDLIELSSRFYYQLNGLQPAQFTELVQQLHSHGMTIQSNIIQADTNPPDTNPPNTIHKEKTPFRNHTFSAGTGQNSAHRQTVKRSSSESSQQKIDRIIHPSAPIHVFKLGNNLPKTFEEFKLRFESNNIDFDKSFEKVYDILHLFRKFLLEFYRENYFQVVFPCLKEQGTDEHSKRELTNFLAYLDKIVEIFAELLKSILRIEYSPEYILNFHECFGNFFFENSETIIKYFERYHDVEIGEHSKQISTSLFRLIVNFKQLIEDLKSISHMFATIFINIDYILNDSDSKIHDHQNHRCLLCILNTFNKANPPIKLSISSQNKNSLIAEMQVLLELTNGSSSGSLKAPVSPFAISYGSQPLSIKKRCNIFLLEDRIIVSEYSRKDDKQSLYFYSYLPKTSVYPVCFNNHKEIGVHTLSEEGIKAFSHKKMLRFVFKLQQDNSERIYRANIQKIERTSLKDLRKEKFAKLKLVNDATKFLTLYKNARDAYDWENLEDDATADFIRLSSIRHSLGEKN